MISGCVNFMNSSILAMRGVVFSRSKFVGIMATALSQYVLAYASLCIENFYPVWSAPLWPASGAALGATLLGGPSMLIGVYLGLLLPSKLCFWGQIPTFTSLLLPLANVAETALAWFLLRKAAKEFNVLLTSQRDLVTFLLLAPWIPALLSATLAQSILFMGRQIPLQNILPELIAYAAGNASGIILLTPLILCWRNIIQLRWKDRIVTQSLGTGLFIGLGVWIIRQDAMISSTVFILLVPVVIWGVWTTGLRGATLNCFILSFLFFNLKPAEAFDRRQANKPPRTDSALYRADAGEIHQVRSILERISKDPLTSQIAMLTVLCLTLFPLGLAADTSRSSAARDRFIMDSLESSLWTWTSSLGYTIHSPRVAAKLPPSVALFLKTQQTGQVKVMPQQKDAPAYVSYWVTTQASTAGIPLQVTGILHSLETQEKMEKAERVAEIANMEITALRSRLNPHLLFNCLTGLRALIQKDPTSAQDFTGKLANFLRNAVDTQARPLISLQEEVSLCRDYLSLETIRGSRLNAIFQIDPAATRVSVPPMSVHTLIENAVKHGKRMKNKALTIQVIARKSRDKKLTIQVIQPGRLKKARPDKTGAGLLLARQQLDLLFQKKGQINLTEDRSGHVTATLEIPIHRKDS